MRIQEFNYDVNLLQSLIWQYDQATNLVSLITKKQTWYNTNQTAFWTGWYNNVFNLLTANTFGLSVWSIILNVPPFLIAEPEDPAKPVWGFNQYNPTFPTLLNSYLNFGFGNFSLKGTVIVLTLEEQRFLLRLRYFQLSTRGDVTDINWFLNYLLTTSDIGYSGVLYMLDNLDMTVTYVFNAGFPPSLFTILQDFDVLPRPAGVGITYSVI